MSSTARRWRQRSAGTLIAAGVAGLLASGLLTGLHGASVQRPLSRATVAPPHAPPKQVELALALKQRDSSGLSKLIKTGETLSVAQYRDRFGPAPSLARRVEHVLRSYGIQASWSPGAPTMAASGSVDAVERAFSVVLRAHVAKVRGASLGTWDRVTYLAPTGSPKMPASLQGAVTSVTGLDGYPDIAPASLAAQGSSGNRGLESAGGFTPSQLAGYYNFTPLYRAGLSGAGQTVVFIETDGYYQSSLDEFASAFRLPAFDLGQPVTEPSWGSVPQPSKDDAFSETTLDLEIVHAMAPKAHLVIYDAGYQSGSATPGAQIVNALQKAVTDYPRAIFSISLGGCEDSVPSDKAGFTRGEAMTFYAVFRQLAATGGSAFVSSGDDGAYSCALLVDPNFKPTLETPASDPYVTAVGGVTASLGSGGTFGSAAAWGSPFQQVGSGGGVSAVFARPWWQKGRGVINIHSNGNRQVPDVAAIGDWNTGWDVCCTDVSDPAHSWAENGGTSAAAPLLAALFALADEHLGQDGLKPVGFADPALYDFGAQPGRFPALAYRDVVKGDNLYYPATSGWDFATGWGVPNAAGLVDDLVAYQRGTR